MTKVFFDGGCRPNPGPIEVAVVIKGICRFFDDLGIGTNGDAEWLALIRSWEWAAAADLPDIVLVGDSRDVVDKARRVLATGQAFSAHQQALARLARQAPPVRIRSIRRAQNLAGIALAARHPR